MRKLFRVSTKAAVFDATRTKVVVIHMDQSSAWGLPGGHVEDGEGPDDAIIRELSEECGITCDDLQRKDFFVHSDGKLILGYVGTANNDKLFSIVSEEEGSPRWLTKKDFVKIEIEPAYRELVLSNW